MLGKAAAAASLSTALSASASPPAAVVSDGPINAPAASHSAAGPSQAAAPSPDAAGALSAAAQAPSKSISVDSGSARSPEPRRTRRDNAPRVQPEPTAAAAEHHPGTAARMDLIVTPRRADAAGGQGRGFSLYPRGVSEPTTPGRESGEARSPLRGSGGGQSPDHQSFSPGGSRAGFTAAELRAYEATNQLLRELHFERLGRLSIRDDDEASVAHTPQQQPHHHPHRRRR